MNEHLEGNKNRHRIENLTNITLVIFIDIFVS